MDGQKAKDIEISDKIFSLKMKFLRLNNSF